MNLLTDPLLRVQTAAGLRTMNLPALMAALGRDEVLSLTGLQRHQADAFHVFLSYLAGVVIARRGETDPIQHEDFWRVGLQNLAGEAGDHAWTLVVDDLSRPAFMQPPLPKGDHKKLKFYASAPDALDLLPTAKNHDVKQARAHMSLMIDEWIYALISLQTMSGYFGRGNPGISRMNGGFGSRTIVELIRDNSPGARWRDAVERLLIHRQDVLAGEYGYDNEGLVLVWLRPWDGRESLRLCELDPFYIEVCRRVRLRNSDRCIYAEAIPSDANRIAAKELNGVVGDAWLPINLADTGRSDNTGGKALTVSAQGITAELMRRLVFADEFVMTPLHRPLPTWKGRLTLTVSVLVRGQGTTDGFHERHVDIPPPVQPRLFGPIAKSDPLLALSRNAIEYAGTMQYRVLKPAVFSYQEGGPEKLQLDRDSVQAWWVPIARRFEILWSDDFFAWLWSVPEQFDKEDILKEWAARLRDHALTVLSEVERVMPARIGRYYRSRVEAERVFWGALYNEKNFSFLKGEKNGTTADS
jgi:CRISPR system Cascade subunit CasA